MSIAPSGRKTDQASLGGRWSAVPEHSEARFHVRDKLVATVHGRMPVEDGGAFVSDDGDVVEAWVEVSVAGIATGNAHRDNDLRKPRLLDAVAHPRVRVEATRAVSTTTGWTARGYLSANEGRAPLDLTATTVATSGDEIRVRVTGRLDRAPLGIKVPSLIIGRFIDVDAELTFRRETVTSPATAVTN